MTESQTPADPPPRAGKLAVILLVAAAAVAFLLLQPRGDDVRREAPAPPPATGATSVVPAVDLHPGERAFTGEVPEEISLIRFDMVRAIELARAKRWFSDARAHDLATAALAKAEDYAGRLETDRLHRAFDGAIRSVAADPDLRETAFDALFAPPYVVCMARGFGESDPASAILAPAAEREALIAESAAKARKRARLMAEVGSLLQQVHAEFVRRHGETAQLRDLMGEFGGRPDLPVAKRSFRDGCPLVVWVSEMRDARLPGTVAFEPRTGRLRIVHRPDRDLAVIRGEVEGAVRRLLHGFRRQRAEWGRASAPPSFFEIGFPVVWSSVEVGSDRTLTWRGSSPWLEALREASREFPQKSAGPFLFPLMGFVRSLGFVDLIATARAGAGAGPQSQLKKIQFAQSAALVSFLRDAADGKRREAFDDFVSEMLDAPADRPEFVRSRFASAFGSEWSALDPEFLAWVVARLKDPPETPPALPALDDWPGFVAPEVVGVAAPR